MKKNFKEQLYHILLFSMLITTNIFFGIFVWIPSDLSPNFALLFCTSPFIIIEFIKIRKLTTQFTRTTEARK